MMEHVSVIVRNTFIEVELPADPISVRRASSLPHKWRARDNAESLIGAGTRLAITNVDGGIETIQTNSQPAVNSSMSTVPMAIPDQSAGKSQNEIVPEIPLSLHQIDRNNCAVRLNALDLCVPQKRASRRASVSAAQESPKGMIIRARSSKHKSRNRSASSDRSVYSGGSHSTASTGSGSATISSGSSHLVCVDSPTNDGTLDGGSSLLLSDKTIVLPAGVDHVSGSRRSRRRRATARRAAEPGQLRVHAPFFEPAAAPISQQGCPLSNEMFDMLAVAQASVLSCPHVLSVQIVKPISHQTRETSIVVSFHPGKVWAHDVGTLAKNAFLEAAGKSEQAFILGYAVDPFIDQSDVGFTATIGSVPVDRQHTICWDFWQKGFCQRCSTCRWCHPVSSDLMDVKFVFEPAQVPLQQSLSSWMGPGFQVDSWRTSSNGWTDCRA